MAKEFAKQFYNSPAWKKARNTYAEKKHHLCEQCLQKGIYATGEIVHHRIELTPGNIEDPFIALDEKNFLLLCRSCHKKIHGIVKDKRWTIDENGKVISR